VIRLRVVAALTGLGALATCGPVAAFVAPESPTGSAPAAQASASALGLLEAAARATRTRAWSGTQRVMSLVTGTPQVTEVRVRHLPGRGSSLDPVARGTALVTADVLDASLLSVLAGNYDLAVVASTVCEERPARVVEARRPGVTGPEGVAGRFWLDVATGLVLQRDVLGADGGLLRRSALRDLHVGPPIEDVAVVQTAGQVLQPRGARLTAAALTALGRRGWSLPRTLPGGMVLFDARLLDDDVLQLSYSDGLSTLSLFGQRGELPPTTTGILRRVGDAWVWESPGTPGRVVWSEHGHTWTLLSDTSPQVLDAVVAALPHGGSTVTQDGLGPRAWRGVARVGAWLNPFD
jgi:sigma-E factor negative regulatory protein RseB